MDYVVVKWLHIVSSTLLFGTGIGSAYYMFFVSLSKEVRAVAAVLPLVVIADWVFTTTTVIFQPLSGFYLMHLAGFDFSSRWIAWSVGLYLLAGACWLPVVWMQIKMRDMARGAVKAGQESLPVRYWRFLELWTILGTIAFLSLVAVFYLMVAKPA